MQRFETRNVSLRGIQRTNSYEVTFRVEKLKHSLSEDLDPLVVFFHDRQSARSFNFAYRLHAENIPKVTEGRLHVVVDLE